MSLVPLHSLLLVEGSPQSSTKDQEQDKKEKVLVCSQCQTTITKDKERIPVNGAHTHSFFNPQGIVYRIGCFNQASGCKPISEPSTNFSWFKGFEWRIVCCQTCLYHLGWDFSRTSAIAFYGLILDRLATATDN